MAGRNFKGAHAPATRSRIPIKRTYQQPAV